MKQFFVVILLLLVAVSGEATTYYVHPSGDNSDGLTWAKAWNGIDSVNVNTASGDTVFFGTGIYRGARLDVIGGTNGDRTVYACSSFVDTNGSGTWHFAKLFASTAVGGWSVYSGSIYTTATVVANNLFAGQELLLKQAGSGIAAGQWWTDGTTETRVWLSDSSNPSNTYMEEDAGRTTIRVDNQDHVTIWGLDVRYGNNRNIEASTGSGGEDSLFIEHCKVGPCAGDFSSNPGNIYSSNTTVGHKFWEIRACSLGAAYALSGTAIVNQHGASIMTYTQDSLLVDSCWFYGYHSLSAIYFKNDDTLITHHMVIRNSEFTSTSGMGLIRMFKHKRASEIYGNTFRDHAGDAIVLGYINLAADTGYSIYNNTFIDVDRPLTTCVDADQTFRKGNIRFKYNVVYGGTSTDINVNQDDLGGPAYPTLIDSNIYFSDGATFSSGGCGSPPNPTEYTFANWHTLGDSWDSNSTVNTSTAQDFNNLPQGDYTRPDASGEMDTTYGGQTWTIYGAYQNASSADMVTNISGMVLKGVTIR